MKLLYRSDHFLLNKMPIAAWQLTTLPHEQKLMHYHPPHLVRPLLPVAWHHLTRQCLDDIATISAIFDVEILVHVAEKRDSDLLISAVMPHDITDEVQSFVSSVCARANEVVPYLCAVCGEIESCAQRNHNGASRWLCREHMSIPLLSVTTDYLPPALSPWLRATAGAVELMARYEPADAAARALARRYNSPRVQQVIGQADALRARIAINEITDTKEVK
jgi:hypothetical protein